MVPPMNGLQGLFIENLWMEAYVEGLATQEAKKKAKRLSATKHKPHCGV